MELFGLEVNSTVVVLRTIFLRWSCWVFVISKVIFSSLVMIAVGALPYLHVKPLEGFALSISILSSFRPGDMPTYILSRVPNDHVFMCIQQPVVCVVPNSNLVRVLPHAISCCVLFVVQNKITVAVTAATPTKSYGSEQRAHE